MRTYFRRYGYQSPNDYLYGPYQFTHDIRQETYSHWQTQPDVINNFDTFMSGGKLNDKRRWCEWVSAKDVVIEGFHHSEDAVLLVDIGGGRGHDLQAFRNKYPDLPGRLILQDRPQVIQEVQGISDTIELMPHSFFDVQPIKGK